MDLAVFILYPMVLNCMLYIEQGLILRGRLTHGSNIQWMMFMHHLSHITYWFLMMLTLGGI